MPVTARLLQRLHDTLGDDATNDLLAWWDESATVNRATTREIADLHFDRFNDRLEKRLAEQRADLIKWMFLFWIGTVVPLAGLMIALYKL
jgi:hypothetical protein